MNGMTSGIPTRFPFRLHRMLEEASQNGRDDLICWLPCGTKFRIRNQKEFAETIMSKYCRHAKYKSFLRQLSMYKFQRVSSGPDKGCYYHPHFLRHRLDLADFINRENIQAVPPSMLAQQQHQQQQQQNTNVDAEVVSLDGSHRGGSELMMMDQRSLENRFGKGDTNNNVIRVVGTHHVVPPISTPDDIVNEIIMTFKKGFLQKDEEEKEALTAVPEVQLLGLLGVNEKKEDELPLIFPDGEEDEEQIVELSSELVWL